MKMKTFIVFYHKPPRTKTFTMEVQAVVRQSAKRRFLRWARQSAVSVEVIAINQRGMKHGPRPKKIDTEE